MKKLVEKENIDIEVYSCGVYAETGDYATYNAIEAMKQYEVNIDNHRATNIRESKIEEMDLILCLALSHKQSVLYLYPNLKGKVYAMKEYAKLDKNGEDMDIKDPWGYDLNIYHNCALEIKECLENTVKNIKKYLL